MKPDLINNTLELKSVDKLTALEFIFRFHYSKVMPRLTKHYVGGFILAIKR